MRTLAAFCLVLGSAVSAQPPAERPGPTKDGFLLPNGWHLTPAGKHITTTDLPLNIVPLKDGHAIGEAAHQR